MSNLCWGDVSSVCQWTSKSAPLRVCTKEIKQLTPPSNQLSPSSNPYSPPECELNKPRFLLKKQRGALVERNEVLVRVGRLQGDDNAAKASQIRAPKQEMAGFRDEIDRLNHSKIAALSDCRLATDRRAELGKEVQALERGRTFGKL